MRYTYQVIRSRRKTGSIQIRDGQIFVRVPLYAKEEWIRQFVNEHADWIVKHMHQAGQREKELAAVPKLTQEELVLLTKRAKRVFSVRAAHYASQMGVNYGKITIRHQRTRWGSCTQSGNLNFNCLLLLAPLEVLDSVVVHELAHRHHMDHSQAFYAEVRRAYPAYDSCSRWLKENGDRLMARLP